MPTPQFLYLFDPLCGWCYASAPALAALADAWPGQIDMLPTGLFSGAGARALTADWADHAWRNDQRIAGITGQVFSEAYRRDILQGSNIQFDSTLMNRALTAIRSLDPLLEPALLHELQITRYSNGRDTAVASVVAEVAARVAARAGYLLPADAFAQRLSQDAALVEETEARIRSTQQLMARQGIRGVPQLLVRAGTEMEAVDTSVLYQEPAQLVAVLRQHVADAAAAPANHG